MVFRSSMKSRDRFFLKWNEYDANMKEQLKILREDQQLFDVTLATDDGHQMQAHKVVLAAGSVFFNDIFRKNNHSNMLIYMRGISGINLEYITDFLYNGEASITDQDLNPFLNAGKELQVKGLLGELQFHRKENDVLKDSDTNTANENEIDALKQESFLSPVEDISDSNNHSKFKADIELDFQIEEIIEKSQERWKCKVCEKTAKTKQKIKNHSETHIKGVSHPCDICNKTFPTRHSLESHVYGIHSSLFTCDVCGKAGMNKATYRSHKQKNHR